MIDATFPLVRARHERQTLRALRREFNRQRADYQSRGMPSDWWDEALARVILARSTAVARDAFQRVARHTPGDPDPTVMDELLAESAGISARSINATTLEHIVELGATVAFGRLVGERSEQAARSQTTRATTLGGDEAAKHGGLRQKRWQVNSGDPRSSHAGVNGETVPLGETFSNGMQGPGDPAGGAEEVANCQCSLVFG